MIMDFFKQRQLFRDKMLVICIIVGAVLQTSLALKSVRKQPDSVDSEKFLLDCFEESAPLNATDDVKIKIFQNRHCMKRCMIRHLFPKGIQLPTEDSGTNVVFAMRDKQPTPFTQEVCSERRLQNINYRKHAACIGSIDGQYYLMCLEWAYMGNDLREKHPKFEVPIFCRSVIGLHRCQLNVIRTACGRETESFGWRFMKDLIHGVKGKPQVTCGDQLEQIYETDPVVA